MLLSIVVAAAADQHPVHLEKNFDPAQCVGCHYEKTKGKSVHSAMALGCTTCHDIKSENEVTTITLVAPNALALCLTCHTDKDAGSVKGQLHAPIAEGCVTCHNPHSSGNQNQLLKTTSGDKSKNLCLACHDKGVNVSEKGSRHAALDAGCDTCHVTHKTGDAEKKEFGFHLAKGPPALCLDCHDATDKAIVAAHSGQPFAQADCTSCHDPHQSDLPKLLQKYVHPPFAEKMCDVCHQASQNNKVVLNEDGKFALCYTCHDDKKKQVESSKNPHPAFLVTEACTECHSPHASRYPRLLKVSPVSVCESCHSDRAEEHKTKKYLHQPAFKDGCSICHEPHGSDFKSMLRTAGVAELCLTCHAAQANSEPASAKSLTIFSGVELPTNYLSSIRRIAVSGDKGHPISGHPVGGVPDPSDAEKKKISCVSCHDPHASDASRRMFRLKPGAKSICLKCHG